MPGCYYKPRWDLVLKDYIETGNMLRSYWKHYPKITTYGAANACSSRFFARPWTKSRLMEINMEAMKRSSITVEKILKDYQDALDMAKKDESPAEMISAAREQAKLVGLLIDRKEIGEAGDFDNMDNISEILEAVGKLAGPEVALALSKAFAVVKEDTNGLDELVPPSGSVN